MAKKKAAKKTTRSSSASASGTRTTKKRNAAHDPTLRTRGGTPRRSRTTTRKAASPTVPKRPRQSALPGLEDRGIADIEEAAHDYVDARDERMRMGEEEQRRHTKLLAVMQKHGKQAYVHDTGSEVIEVKIKPKDATAKAKVRIVASDEYVPEGQRGPKVVEEPEIGGDDEPEVDGEVDDEEDEEDESDGAQLDDEEDDEEGDDVPDEDRA